MRRVAKTRMFGLRHMRRLLVWFRLYWTIYTYTKWHTLDLCLFGTADLFYKDHRFVFWGPHVVLVELTWSQIGNNCTTGGSTNTNCGSPTGTVVLCILLLILTKQPSKSKLPTCCAVSIWGLVIALCPANILQHFTAHLDLSYTHTLYTLTWAYGRSHNHSVSSF